MIGPSGERIEKKAAQGEVIPSDGLAGSSQATTPA